MPWASSSSRKPRNADDEPIWSTSGSPVVSGLNFGSPVDPTVQRELGAVVHQVLVQPGGVLADDPGGGVVAADVVEHGGEVVLAHRGVEGRHRRIERVASRRPPGRRRRCRCRRCRRAPRRSCRRGRCPRRTSASTRRCPQRSARGAWSGPWRSRRSRPGPGRPSRRRDAPTVSRSCMRYDASSWSSMIAWAESGLLSPALMSWRRASPLSSLRVSPPKVAASPVRPWWRIGSPASQSISSWPTVWVNFGPEHGVVLVGRAQQDRGDHPVLGDPLAPVLGVDPVVGGGVAEHAGQAGRDARLEMGQGLQLVAG